MTKLPADFKFQYKDARGNLREMVYTATIRNDQVKISWVQPSGTKESYCYTQREVLDFINSDTWVILEEKGPYADELKPLEEKLADLESQVSFIKEKITSINKIIGLEEYAKEIQTQADQLKGEIGL